MGSLSRSPRFTFQGLYPDFVAAAGSFLELPEQMKAELTLEELDIVH